MSEIRRIARSSSSVRGFYEKNSALTTRMEKQGRNRGKLIKQIMKAYENHQLVCQKCDVLNRDILRTFFFSLQQGDRYYYISVFE